MEETQLETVARLYMEAMRPYSDLHRHIVLDLRTGSVKMGSLIRNNPPVASEDIDDTIQDVFAQLLKLHWPWTTDLSIEKRAVERTRIKEATLRVLSLKRSKIARRVIEPSSFHPMLISGNVNLPVDDEGELIEYQDTFREEQRLSTNSTILVTPTENWKSLSDYRATSKVKAVCCPEKSHYAKGWCVNHYHILGDRVRRNVLGEVPRCLSPLRKKAVAKTKPSTELSRLLTKVAGLRGKKRAPLYEEDASAWRPERYHEYLRTKIETWPLATNHYSHAQLVRSLNAMSQSGRSALYNTSLLTYNQSLGSRPEEDSK